jgi:hypothetical protein
MMIERIVDPVDPDESPVHRGPRRSATVLIGSGTQDDRAGLGHFLMSEEPKTFAGHPRPVGSVPAHPAVAR